MKNPGHAETGQPPEPNLFKPHPNLTDEVNRAIIQSEIEGGFCLDNLAIGKSLQVTTENSVYTFTRISPDEYEATGNPQFFPKPTKVRIFGSTWGGSMLKQDFVGRGMRLQMFVPKTPEPYLTTSRIQEIKEL